MIHHIAKHFTSGYTVRRPTTVDGAGGGRHREYQDHIINAVGHLQVRSASMVFAAGVDTTVHDAMFYCPLGLDILEHDQIVDLFSDVWLVKRVHPLRKPVTYEGFLQIGLEKVKT